MSLKNFFLIVFFINYVNTLPVMRILNTIPVESFQSNHIKAMRISEKMCDLYARKIKTLRLGSTRTFVDGFSEKPYVAVIGWKGESEILWDCTGFLVSDSFVITAAHCVRGNPSRKIKNPPSYIRLGQYNISSIDLRTSVDFKIEKIFTNPKRKLSKVHDIALIQFKKSKTFEFNKFVQPICLQAESNQDAKEFFAYGWGEITKEFNEITVSRNIKLSKTEILKEVKLKVVSGQECSKTFNNNWYQLFDENFNYCAKPKNVYQDTCQADSGGPIVIRDTKKNIEIAIGVTNRGYSFCNNQSLKPVGIYLKLFPYLNWIEQTVWKSTFRYASESSLQYLN